MDCKRACETNLAEWPRCHVFLCLVYLKTKNKSPNSQFPIRAGRRIWIKSNANHQKSQSRCFLVIFRSRPTDYQPQFVAVVLPVLSSPEGQPLTAPLPFELSPAWPKPLSSCTRGSLQRTLVCPYCWQLEHCTLLPLKFISFVPSFVRFLELGWHIQSFGSGQSRLKCPVFSQLRHVTLSMLRGWSQSLDMWPSCPQLWQPRLPPCGQSLPKCPSTSPSGNCQ